MARASYRRIAAPSRSWPYGNRNGTGSAVHKFRRLARKAVRAAGRRELRAS